MLHRAGQRGGRREDGTRARHANGYTLVKVAGAWILEHRHVMQHTLGRELLRSERVHHRNGKRDDNRPENLELWTTSHKDPAGTRVVDWVVDQLLQQPEVLGMPSKHRAALVKAARRLAAGS